MKKRRERELKPPRSVKTAFKDYRFLALGITFSAICAVFLVVLAITQINGAKYYFPRSDDIIKTLSKGHVSYVINTIDVNQHNTRLDGYGIRNAAVENNVSIITALETVSTLLDVLEEITLGVSTIDAEGNNK